MYKAHLVDKPGCLLTVAEIEAAIKRKPFYTPYYVNESRLLIWWDDDSSNWCAERSICSTDQLYYYADKLETLISNIEEDESTLQSAVVKSIAEQYDEEIEEGELFDILGCIPPINLN